MQKQILIMLDYFWTEDLSKEIGLEPVPLQLEHVATKQSRNHHTTHLGRPPFQPSHASAIIVLFVLLVRPRRICPIVCL